MKIIFRCDPTLTEILPRPIPARHGLPSWLRRMPGTAFSPLHGHEIRTVKQCPPFIDAMMLGFQIPLPCDVRVERGVFSWDWPLPPLSVEGHTRSPLSFHVAEQVTGTPLFGAGHSIIKFNCFWTIELETGWSLFATHPVNRPDLPFRLVTGLVDADRFHSIGIFFPAQWTDPDFSGVLARGTPVAQCFAVPRAMPELICEGFDAEHIREYGETSRAVLSMPGVYRRRYRARRKPAPMSVL
jgi:hypothetical protein